MSGSGASQLGEAFRSILPLRHRQALTGAAEIFLDEWLDDIGGPGSVRDALPPRYRMEFSPRLARQLWVCLVLVVWKLGQPAYPGVACVAEQLVIQALIERARALLEMDGADAGDRAWGDFEDAVYPDTDFEILFSPDRDGLAESRVGELLGMVSLRFEDLFATQYAATTGPLHPLLDQPARPRPEDRAAALAELTGDADGQATTDAGARTLVGRDVAEVAAPAIMAALRARDIPFSLEWDGATFAVYVEEDDQGILCHFTADTAPRFRNCVIDVRGRPAVHQQRCVHRPRGRSRPSTPPLTKPPVRSARSPTCCRSRPATVASGPPAASRPPTGSPSTSTSTGRRCCW
jgi:hypothetical protein